MVFWLLKMNMVFLLLLKSALWPLQQTIVFVRHMLEDRRREKERWTLRAWERQVRQELDRLEKTMDPLPARVLYNMRSSRIHNLPPEMLLSILQWLRGDPVTLFILCRVSRVFRRAVSLGLVRDQSHNLHLCQFGDVPQPGMAGPMFFIYHTGLHRHFHPDRVKELRYLLRKDGICDRCWRKPADDGDGENSKKRLCWAKCRLLNSGTRRIICAGCDTDHPETFYSPEERAKNGLLRVCIAREGHLRLCDHVTVKWEDVEQTLRGLRGTLSPGRLISPLSPFSSRCQVIRLAECHHESHRTGWCDRERMDHHTPALTLSRFPEGIFWIEMSWVAHSGRDAFSINRPGGRENTLTEREMRDIVLRNRENGGQHIIPALFPGHLPEMACFSDGLCDCIDYQCDASVQTVFESTEFIHNHHSRLISMQPGSNTGRAAKGHAKSDGLVRMRRCAGRYHLGKDTGTSSPCFVTMYTRTLVGRDHGFSNIQPPHDWYHAVDRTSHGHQQSSWRWTRSRDKDSMTLSHETCDDPACLNYYNDVHLHQCREGEREVRETAQEGYLF